jgi:CHAT domain-containing protein/Tfp pilus assembly protein PilF
MIFLLLFSFLCQSSQSNSDVIMPNSASAYTQKFYKNFNIAEHLVLKGDNEGAWQLFKECLYISQRGGLKREELEANLKNGIIAWNLGQLKESEIFYKNAYAIAKILGMPNKEKECLGPISIYRYYQEGKDLRSSGQYDKSIQSFNKAIELARQINSPGHELKCQRQMSICYWELNSFDEFHELNQKALSLAQQIKNRYDEGICLNNIGLYYWKIDNYSTALKYFENALEIAQKIHNVQSENECLNNIGIIYKEIGDYDKALSYLTKALSIDKQSFGNNYISIDLNNIGTTYRKKGLINNNKSDFHEALIYFNKSLEIIKNTNDRKSMIHIYNNIGTVYADLEDYSNALEFYKHGLSLANLINDSEGTSLLLNNIGIVYSNLGDYAESTKYFQKAIDLALGIKAGQILWEAFLEAGNSYKKQAHFSEALKYYKNSIEIIENTRSSLEIEELKASYLGTDKRIEAYYNLIDLLVRLHQSQHQKNNYDEEAFNYLEKAKARAFLDNLEVSEVSISQGISQELINRERQLNNEITKLYKKLMIPQLTSKQKQEINEQLLSLEEDYDKLKREIRTSSPAYANLKYPEIVSLKEVQEKLLDENSAFYEYSIGNENSYCFVISKNRLKIFPISPRKELQPKVAAHIKSISDKDNHSFKLGYELYNEIIRPGLSPNIKRIIIIPDDILYYLPFEALLDEKNGRWLIQDFSISYAPSISSFREILCRHENQKKRNKKDILAFGDPLYDNQESLDNLIEWTSSADSLKAATSFKFQRLYYSSIETNNIASLFNKKRRDIFRGEMASEQTLKSIKLDDYRIIHFSVHSFIDDQKPARSSIVLSLNKDSHEDGFVQTREVYNLKMNADLVSLSACQTGLGQYIRGEGIEGLNRAFFYAGASSVLMSLWSINDQASAELIKRFYFHVLSSDSIIIALQKAKLEMISSKTLSHPYFWAGFVITGDSEKVLFPNNKTIWVLIGSSFCLAAIVIFGLRNFTRKRFYLVNQD